MYDKLGYIGFVMVKLYITYILQLLYKCKRERTSGTLPTHKMWIKVNKISKIHELSVYTITDGITYLILLN